MWRNKLNIKNDKNVDLSAIALLEEIGQFTAETTDTYKVSTKQQQRFNWRQIVQETFFKLSIHARNSLEINDWAKSSVHILVGNITEAFVVDWTPSPSTTPQESLKSLHDRCFTWKTSLSGSADVHSPLCLSFSRYELRMRYFPKGYLSHFSEDRPSLNYLYHQVTAQTPLATPLLHWSQTLCCVFFYFCFFLLNVKVFAFPFGHPGQKRLHASYSRSSRSRRCSETGLLGNKVRSVNRVVDLLVLASHFCHILVVPTESMFILCLCMPVCVSFRRFFREMPGNALDKKSNFELLE